MIQMPTTVLKDFTAWEYISGNVYGFVFNITDIKYVALGYPIMKNKK